LFVTVEGHLATVVAALIEQNVLEGAAGAWGVIDVRRASKNDTTEFCTAIAIITRMAIVSCSSVVEHHVAAGDSPGAADAQIR
jgi:hypothetical protein